VSRTSIRRRRQSSAPATGGRVCDLVPSLRPATNSLSSGRSSPAHPTRIERDGIFRSGIDLLRRPEWTRLIFSSDDNRPLRCSHRFQPIRPRDDDELHGNGVQLDRRRHHPNGQATDLHEAADGVVNIRPSRGHRRRSDWTTTGWSSRH